MTTATAALQVACTGYVVLAHALSLAFILRSLPVLRRSRGFIREAALPPPHPAFERPVSVVIVCTEPDPGLVARVQAILALDYPEMEVVVVNEGGDAALAGLTEAWGLEVFPEAHWRRLPAQPVRAIHHGGRDARIRVVDKEPGGRADALNSGINASRFPLVCVMEPDAVLREDALHRLSEPFIDDPRAVATCSAGLPPEPPSNARGREHVLQDFRALLTDIGRSATGTILTCRRGVVVMRRDAAVEAGGLHAGDEPIVADLLARMQGLRQDGGGAGRIAIVTEPICRLTGAEKMDDRAHLAQQRAIVQVLHRHGWRLARSVAEKLALALDAYRPALAPLAYGTMAVLWLAGSITAGTLAAFVAMGLALGVLVSATTLAIAVAYLERFAAAGPVAPLVVTAAFEWAGLRQRAWAWRLAGLARAIF